MILTYEKPTPMREALKNLASILKRAKKDNESYKKLLRGALHRRGNVNEEDEKMSFYIDGILPTAHYRRSFQ